jgi:4-hydroxybenzoate polyprenyltransferase
MDGKTTDNFGILKNPISFLARWRPFPLYELISYIFMYASVPMLAYGIKDYNDEIIKLIILTVLTLYSGFFAALIWNDITDAEIDIIAHPNRPVPKGRISKKKFFIIALIFSALTFIFGFLVSLWCLILVGITALFVAFHDKFLKKIIKIPAYSEIFTPIQWLTVAIFGYLAIWTALPISYDISFSPLIIDSISFSQYSFLNMIILVFFTYFADDAHDIPEGIHDVEGDKRSGVRTYATSFGVKKAALISFCMFIISGIFGIFLFIRTALSFIFLLPFIFLWFWIVYKSYILVRSPADKLKQMGKIVGRNGYDYFLMTYNLIFIDLFIQLINYHYNFF